MRRRDTTSQFPNRLGCWGEKLVGPNKGGGKRRASGFVGGGRQLLLSLLNKRAFR